MTHAIKLPEVIQTRTRDELTSRFAILKSKLKRMAILMQGTINLIALFFTHIQSTPCTSPSKNEWKLECHTYTRAKKLSNTWSNITAIKHATFLWTTGQWFTSYKEFYIHSLQFSNCWENFLWIIHESLYYRFKNIFPTADRAQWGLSRHGDLTNRILKIKYVLCGKYSALYNFDTGITMAVCKPVLLFQ